MNSVAVGTYKPIPMRQVAFLFLLLFIVSSAVDLRFSAGGKGFFTLSNFELCGYMLILSLAVSACVHSFSRDAVASLSDSLHRWLLLYFFWGIFAALLAKGEVGKFMIIDLKKLLPAIIGYFSIILMITSYKKANLLIAAWICAGMVNVALALSQFFLGGPHPVKPGQNALEKLDIGGDVASSLVTGFFSHPNLFSQIIIPYFVVFTTAWLLSDKLFSMKSVKFFILSIVFGFVLLLTNAKGAILWSVIAIVTGVAMSKWKKLRTLFFFTCSWLICVIGINSLALLLVLNIVEYDALRTLFSRILFILTSFNIFTDHPSNFLFGGGMRFWPEYASIWANWNYPNAHNVYLNQMLFYGAIGLGLLVSFVLAHVKRGLTALGNNIDPLLSPWPYLAAVFAFGGSYFFEPSFGDPIQKFQLFFVLAMSFVLPRVHASNPTASKNC